MKRLLLASILFLLCGMCTASVLAAEKVVYVADGGNGDGLSVEAPLGTLDAAYAALGSDGGTVVVVGKLTVASTFTEPTHSGKVTVTQVYGGKDYRTGDDYGIKIGGCRYILNGDTTFEHITFRGTGSYVLFVAQFNVIEMGEGIVCTGYGDCTLVSKGPAIIGGVQHGADKYDTVHTDLDSHIIVKSGTFVICGVSRQVDKNFEGMAHIDISGGTIYNIYPGNGTSGTAGDVDLRISGGTFMRNLVTGSVSVITGTLNIKVTGGDFTNFMTADGTVAEGATSTLDVSEYADSAALVAKASNFTQIITDAGTITTKVPNDRFAYATFTASDGTKLPYRYYLPEDYETSAKSYPVFLYMHGNGSRGSNNTTQLTTNGAALNNEVFNSVYDCIMLAPQCEKSPKQWVTTHAGSEAFLPELESGVYESGEYLNAAVELLDYFINTYRADTSRVYITGSSNGGAATWSLTARYPHVFAAAIPLAGCRDSSAAAAIASRYAHQNIWTFHGDADTTVPVEGTRGMVAAIRAAGSTSIDYTELPGEGHNIWAQAAATPGIVDWMFSKTNANFVNSLRGDRAALSVPSAPAWNENTVTFGAVDGARAYRVTVYADGTPALVYETAETVQTIELSALSGEISFTVTALANDLASNINSVESAACAYSADPAEAYDFDGNGKVDLSDALMLLQEGLNQDNLNLQKVVQVIKYIVSAK